MCKKQQIGSDSFYSLRPSSTTGACYASPLNAAITGLTRDAEAHVVLCESINWLASSEAKCEGTASALNQVVDAYLDGTYEHCRLTTPTTSPTTSVTTTTTATTTGTTTQTTTPQRGRLQCYDQQTKDGDHTSYIVLEDLELRDAQASYLSDVIKHCTPPFGPNIFRRLHPHALFYGVVYVTS